MTKEQQAIEILWKEYKCVDRDCDIERSCGKCDLMIPTKEPILQAYEIAIRSINLIDCLTDRPCQACVYHKDNGCCRWDCIFEDKGEQE